MKKNFLADYCASSLFKLASLLLKPMPAEWVYFIGRRLGDLLYAFDAKHRAIAYANIRRALKGSSCSCIRNTTVKFYRNFGQNIIELFIMGRMDKGYIRKYITIEGFDNITESLKKGKGVIFLVVHAGSWELANIVSAQSGYPYAVIVRGQEFPRLNNLLNHCRRKAGARIIDRQEGLSGLIRALKDNFAVAMTIDQGGREGEHVNFFAKDASMSSGAIKLGLRYNAALLPVFCRRIHGPYAKITIAEPVALKTYQSEEDSVRNNLQGAIQLFEDFLKKHPEEYLWTYKAWKYSRERNILILSDGKAGHLRQSESLAALISGCLKEKGIGSTTNAVEIKFRNRFLRAALLFSSLLAGKYSCQGCLWCLKTFLDKGILTKLASFNPDIIISAGSSLAPVNYVLSRECLAKSAVIMKPAFLSTHKFDLVIVPRHDHPPKNKNIVVTEGALNLVDGEYLRIQSERLRTRLPALRNRVIGLLIGGDSRGFSLAKDRIAEVIRQVKSAAEGIDADILVTTSRRTSADIERLVKDEFSNYSRLKLMVIANEKNIPEAVGGTLGLSSLAVVSPESISMVSEAASSAKPVFVFKASGLGRRHSAFLKNLCDKQFINLVEADKLGRGIEEAAGSGFIAAALEDRIRVKEALGRIL